MQTTHDAVTQPTLLNDCKDFINDNCIVMIVRIIRIKITK